MQGRAPAAAVALGLALALAPATASARERDAADDDGSLRLEQIDARGPVRFGAGYSSLLHAPVISLSFEDEIGVLRLGAAHLGVIVGMDGYRAPDLPNAEGDRARRGFLAVGGGANVALRLGRPLLSVGATGGPGWQSGGDSLLPRGFGVAGRAAVFPFYVTMTEGARCERGWFSTYVLSGLSVWGLARRDWVGVDSGNTLAAGVGIELGRNVLMPVLHQVMTGRCGT